jgi:hypothetical protein
MLPKMWRGLKRLFSALQRMIGRSDHSSSSSDPPTLSDDSGH